MSAQNSETNVAEARLRLRDIASAQLRDVDKRSDADRQMAQAITVALATAYGIVFVSYLDRPWAIIVLPLICIVGLGFTIDAFKRHRGSQKWHNYWIAKIKSSEQNLSEELRVFSVANGDKPGGSMRLQNHRLIAECVAWLIAAATPVALKLGIVATM